MERKIKQVMPPPLRILKKRVAAYARVSTGKDTMLHSLTAQVSYYQDLISNHVGWEFAGIYADEAISGTGNNRPEFVRMLVDCENGEIDYIITKSISRFARNTLTLLSTVRELTSRNIGIFFEEQNIDTLSHEGELLLSILASVAQEESRSISENCRWRIRKAFEQGIPTSFDMLGYTITDGEIVIVPDEADTVKRIYELFLMGLGLKSICNVINEEGRTTRFGNPFIPQSVWWILHNEKYCGNMMLQKTYSRDHMNKKRLLNNGELPKYYVENSHEAIIDPRIYEEVQAEIRRRGKMLFYPHTGVSDEFTSKIRCGICGKCFRRKKRHSKHIWACSTYLTKGVKCCQAKAIPEETLQKLCVKVLGTDEYSSDDVELGISHIEALPNMTIKFYLTSGLVTTENWSLPSRSDSWSVEMKTKARERSLVLCQEKVGQ